MVSVTVEYISQVDQLAIILTCVCRTFCLTWHRVQPSQGTGLSTCGTKPMQTGPVAAVTTLLVFPGDRDIYV